MRIALLAPLVSPIATPFLGGAQRLLADLATGLARRGADVTLYASPGSAVAAVRLVTLDVRPDEMRPATFTSEARADEDDAGDEIDPADLPASHAFLRAYRRIAERAREHDVVHAHAFDWGAFAYSTVQPLPTVHTLHLPAVDPGINRVLGQIAPPDGSPRHADLVTVSRSCAETYAPVCSISRMIYNGTDVVRIPFGASASEPEYLLFAGRITPEKGVEDALEIARRAGKTLLLAGNIYDDRYYREHVQPYLEAPSADVRYVGDLPSERLWSVMAGASAVLCPVHWDEPFGLVACEAQAAGTPVIGYARAGLREVVASGETGWLVPPGDIDAAATAVGHIAELSRAACRERVTRLFSLKTMLDAYEAFYREMLGVGR